MFALSRKKCALFIILWSSSYSIDCAIHSNFIISNCNHNKYSKKPAQTRCRYQVKIRKACNILYRRMIKKLFNNSYLYIQQVLHNNICNIYATFHLHTPHLLNHELEVCRHKTDRSTLPTFNPIVNMILNKLFFSNPKSQIPNPKSI